MLVCKFVVLKSIFYFKRQIYVKIYQENKNAKKSLDIYKRHRNKEF